MSGEVISFHTKNLDWFKVLCEGQWQLMMPIMWNQVLNLGRIGWTWKLGGTAGDDILVFKVFFFGVLLLLCYKSHTIKESFQYLQRKQSGP